MGCCVVGRKTPGRRGWGVGLEFWECGWERKGRVWGLNPGEGRVGFTLESRERGGALCGLNP